MKKKLFITFNEMHNNGIKLAHQIITDQFIPNVIYTNLRGGAYLANIISEYFKVYQEKQNLPPILYAAVLAHSYNNIEKQRSEIRLDGWTYDPKYLRMGDKILLVDDIYDSGRTITYLHNLLLNHGIESNNIRIVVHDFKEQPDNNNLILPHYYMNTIAHDTWVHYFTHELQGLTAEEIKQHYNNDPQVYKIIHDLLN